MVRLGGGGVPEKHQEHRTIETPECWHGIRYGSVIASWGSSPEGMTVGGYRQRTRAGDDGTGLGGRRREEERRGGGRGVERRRGGEGRGGEKRGCEGGEGWRRRV